MCDSSQSAPVLLRYKMMHHSFRCLSCQEVCDLDDAGTCNKCYAEAREIDDLKAKLAFLTLLSPVDHDNHYGSDVVLVASDEGSAEPLSVPAHKAVLVCRSPVFKAMLENDTEERGSGVIKIRDVSYDALRAFINFLYTAEACLDDEIAFNLLALAEKYLVKHLRSYCEKFLMAKLNWDKALSNFSFAYQYNSKQLQDAALKLIIDNMDKLAKHEEYMALVESKPHIVVKIYEAYHSKMINTASY